MPRAGFLKAMGPGACPTGGGEPASRGWEAKRGAGSPRGEQLRRAGQAAGRGHRLPRGFLCCSAGLSFVSILLCKLRSFPSFTLGREAAPVWSAPRLCWGAGHPLGKVLGFAWEPTGRGWEGTEPPGPVGFGGKRRGLKLSSQHTGKEAFLPRDMGQALPGTWGFWS